MGEIRLLDPTVANQIAAGEVVTRPAAVVKELMENAVDASAKNITLMLSQSGEALICVIDDGTGIPTEQIPMAFARHATSKIRTSQDIFKIGTLGFRGEALASIASVAEVEMKTRTAESQTGTAVLVREGKIESSEEVSMPVGTSLSVYNLFYNTPARRKFLKSDAYEKRLCLDEFEHVALANPSIGFTLRVDDMSPVVYPPCSLHDRVVMIAKKKVSDSLFHVSLETELLKIDGWTASPNCQVQGSRDMYFFVNGRYMNPRLLSKAVTTAYGKLLPEGKTVPCYLYLQVPADSIDVNVHPTKAEIKFDNEREVWDLVRSAVRRAVGSSYEVPELDFDAGSGIDIPLFKPGRMVSETPKTTDTLKSYNPFNIDFDDKHPSVDSEAEKVPFKEDLPSGIFARVVTETAPAVELFNSDTIGETLRLGGKYFAVMGKMGLTIIHYARAQERIEYERLLTLLSSQETQAVSQRLLIPETISMSLSDSMSLLSRVETLSTLGFEIGDMGGGVISVYAVPASYSVNGRELQQLFDDMVVEFAQYDDIQRSEMEKTAAALAKTYSVRREVPTDAELRIIAENLMACQSPMITPSSSLSTMWVIPTAEIEKHFKR